MNKARWASWRTIQPKWYKMEIKASSQTLSMPKREAKIRSKPRKRHKSNKLTWKSSWIFKSSKPRCWWIFSSSSWKYKAPTFKLAQICWIHLSINLSMKLQELERKHPKPHYNQSETTNSSPTLLRDSSCTRTNQRCRWDQTWAHNKRPRWISFKQSTSRWRRSTRR